MRDIENFYKINYTVRGKTVENIRWKSCIIYFIILKLQLILVPAFLYVENHYMSVNVIEITLSESRP